MKLFLRYLFIGLSILLLVFGISWTLATDRASPAPSGEAYRLAPDWPHLPDHLVLGQVTGVDVASNGNVFVFYRAERIWKGEEIELEFIASPTILVLDGDTGE